MRQMKFVLDAYQAKTKHGYEDILHFSQGNLELQALFIWGIRHQKHVHLRQG